MAPGIDHALTDFATFFKRRRVVTYVNGWYLSMRKKEIFSRPAPRTQTIDVRVTIDTTSVPRPRDTPGDAANPTSIAQDQAYMVVTASREVENQGSGDVVFEACADDTVRFFISSGSNNFEQIALLENIHHAGGDEVLKDFKSQIVERPGIAPDSHTKVLPARVVQQQFRFSECTVVGGGSGSYDLVFALYDSDEEAQPRLIGHYRWAMQLTITQ